MSQNSFFSEFLLFADDIKIFCVMRSAEDCKLLQPNIGYVQRWCIENYMKINIFKTNINSFTRKTNSGHFNYFGGDLLIIWTDCIKDLGIMLDSKLHFHCHIAHLHSWALKLLWLIRFITYNFSSLDGLKVLYITLIHSKLEYTSVCKNNLTLANSNKLENIQRKSANLCYNSDKLFL
jgi:hypothetical protein